MVKKIHTKTPAFPRGHGLIDQPLRVPNLIQVCTSAGVTSRNAMSINESAAWKAIEAHKAALGDISLKQLFADDKDRFSKFTVQFEDILLDYSKNWVTEDTMKLLAGLLGTARVAEYAKKMFSGEIINFTEKRAVLHTALRNRSNTPVLVDGKDVMPEVRLSFRFEAENMTDKIWDFFQGAHLSPTALCTSLTNETMCTSLCGTSFAGCLR